MGLRIKQPWPGLLLTIGYGRIIPGVLAGIADALDLDVIDVRLRPFSRKPGFNRNRLSALLGERYQCRGDQLGGDGHVTAEGIAYLASALKAGRRLLLLCAEEEPGDCHRHHDILAPHFGRGHHIYRNTLIEARELSRALRFDEDTADGIPRIAGLLPRGLVPVE